MRWHGKAPRRAVRIVTNNESVAHEIADGNMEKIERTATDGEKLGEVGQPL